jgi:hypothetical protein
MKALQNLSQELYRLTAFHKATVYSYEQAELTINYKKKIKIPFDTETPEGLLVRNPVYFKITRSSKIEIRKNLNELVFVRLISALEVFLVDVVRDIFLVTKEPFKRNDLRLELNHAELLSIRSTAEISSKIINKECRKLTSAGYDDIVKYYKRHFEIDLNSFAPGKSKIDEYHDRRHLLVHRLGKTDSTFRQKYNYFKNSIDIGEDYLFQCITEFKDFAQLVSAQVGYYIQNILPIVERKNEGIERRVKIEVKSCNEMPEFFDDNFEFWVDDEFRMLRDIIHRRENHSDCDFDITVAGTAREVKSYLKVVRRNSRKIKFHINEINEFYRVDKNESGKLIKLLDAEMLDKVKCELPSQPWPKGIHKVVATKLGTTNKLVSIAIQQLIGNKVFRPQVDGVVLESEE